MIINVGKKKLKKLVKRQINKNFLLEKKEKNLLESSNILDLALSSTEFCFKEIDIKYFWKEKDLIFNVFNTDQYSMFLYFLSREVKNKTGFENLADKIYYLNKMLNGLDLYHDVELPKIFLLGHPVGTVIGRATFGNFFTFQHGCTVGMNKGVYPVFGENVRMFANSSVLGNCHIGDNVFISAGTTVKDENVPSDTIVFGSSPNLVFKKKQKEYFYSLNNFKRFKNEN